MLHNENRLIYKKIGQGRCVFIFINIITSKKHVIKIKRVDSIISRDFIKKSYNFNFTDIDLPVAKFVSFKKDYVFEKYDFIEGYHKTKIEKSDNDIIIDFLINLSNFREISLNSYFNSDLSKIKYLKNIYIFEKKSFDFINNIFFNNDLNYNEYKVTINNLKPKFILRHLWEKNLIFRDNLLSGIIDINYEIGFTESVIIENVVYNDLFDIFYLEKEKYVFFRENYLNIKCILIYNLINYIKWYLKNNDSQYIIYRYVRVINKYFINRKIQG